MNCHWHRFVHILQCVCTFIVLAFRMRTNADLAGVEKLVVCSINPDLLAAPRVVVQNTDIADHKEAGGSG